MLVKGILFCVSCILVSVWCHPTFYRMKGNKVLEPDLVPVSSTVIPLPSYQVGYGLNVTNPNKYFKNSQHTGTKLITDENVKKYYYGEKKRQQNEKKEKSESVESAKIQTSR